MSYFGRPIDSRDQATGIGTWLWADHDGLHCDPTPPDGIVPTGHLWGWGEDSLVHLREDVAAPTKGILVSREQEDGATKLVTIKGLREGEYPSVVTEPNRFLRCATPEDEHRVEKLDIEVVVVVSPTHAVLMRDRKS